MTWFTDINYKIENLTAMSKVKKYGEVDCQLSMSGMGRFL